VVHDVSERGCYAVTQSRYPVGEMIEINCPRFGKRLQGTVVVQSDQGVHVRFTGDGISAAELDRISMATIADLVGIAKEDHVKFVKHVAELVSSGQASERLATAHACRLGRWYDSLSDAATLALPSFQAIAGPHRAVHDCGQQVIDAVASRNAAEAQRLLRELQQHSERVLRCLDDFGREYSSTTAQQQASTGAIAA